MTTPPKESLMKHLLAYASNNAIAIVALFVALGGTSYAAFSIPANSVGTKQIRKGAGPLEGVTRVPG
jgi:hypothetical protein